MNTYGEPAPSPAPSTVADRIEIDASVETPLALVDEGSLRILRRDDDGFECLLRTDPDAADGFESACTSRYCKKADVLAETPDQIAYRLQCRRDDPSRCAFNRGHIEDLEDEVDRKLRHVRLTADEGEVRLEASLRKASPQARDHPKVIEIQPESVSLRPIEEETLEVALALGYYDKPRNATMEDIAQVLGISKSAVYHRLSDLEGKAVERLWRGGR